MYIHVLYLPQYIILYSTLSLSKVEDRRLQTERDLITMKVKYQSLERTHHTLLQSYKKLKVMETFLLIMAKAFHIKL